MRRKYETEWKGLQVSGLIITGDWEGDPNVINGVHYLPDYVDDLEITLPDGDDLQDYLLAKVIDDICRNMIEEWRDEE